MKRAVLALLLVAATSPQLMGAILIPFNYSGAENDVSFDNYEMVLRSVAAGTGDLTLAGGDFDIVGIADAIEDDDYLVTIFTANGLKIDGNNVNSPYLHQELTGYSVFQIDVAGTGVNDPPNTPSLVFKATDLDPFGILTAADLSADVALKVFADANQDFTHQTGGAKVGVQMPTAADLIADVGSATNGEFFASFGFGAAIDSAYGGVTNPVGFWESTIPAPLVGTTRSSTSATSSFGLNVKEVFSSEIVFTGVMSGYSELEHSIIGQSNFEANTGVSLVTNPGSAGVTADYRDFRDNGTSNWMYHSDDPVVFSMVPEPSGLAIFSGFVALTIGFGAWCRIRKVSAR